MKAQSDLIGDYERRAEMTRPRLISEVTNWMRIDELGGMSRMYEEYDGLVNALTRDITDVGGEFTSITKSLLTDKPMCLNSEVNDCPAAWQQAVGNSVNSADICPPETCGLITA